MDFQSTKGTSMMIQGLKANPKDADAHILFFDIEALIGKHDFDRTVVSAMRCFVMVGGVAQW